MSKPGKRTRRSRGTPDRPGPAPAGAASRRSDTPATRTARDERSLLARILDTPGLAAIVPRLQPEVLYRVIERCGLEDCGELVSLATPAQLSAVFDLDLWRSNRPGLDEHFNAERFGEWLEVLVQQGAAAAARTLTALDPALLTAALSRHVRVFDPVALAPAAEIAGDEMPASAALAEGASCGVGGYLVVARSTAAWDAIVDVLVALAENHGEAFHRVMRGCRRLSNSAPEIDGCDDLLADSEQVLFDLASHREQRREAQGFATPAEARAFLDLLRRPDAVRDRVRPSNPVAAAYFRHLDEAAADGSNDGTTRLPATAQLPASDNSGPAAAALVDVLIAEGVLPRPTRGLLDRGDPATRRLMAMQRHMRFVLDHDAAAYLVRTQELAFLANALVAGCPLQGRPFTPQEASDAAVAVCNVGLQNAPPRWLASQPRPGFGSAEHQPLPESFLVTHDLVSVFQIGWHVLYDQVCMHAAQRLVQVLADLECHDREIQSGLEVLRRKLQVHWQAGAPWRAREALDVLTSLDLPAWAAMLALIAECPVMHAAIRASQSLGTLRVSPSDFEFISDNGQIASIRAFMNALPRMLTG